MNDEAQWRTLWMKNLCLWKPGHPGRCRTVRSDLASAHLECHTTNCSAGKARRQIHKFHSHENKHNSAIQLGLHPFTTQSDTNGHSKSAKMQALWGYFVFLFVWFTPSITTRSFYFYTSVTCPISLFILCYHYHIFLIMIRITIIIIINTKFSSTW